MRSGPSKRGVTPRNVSLRLLPRTNAEHVRTPVGLFVRGEGAGCLGNSRFRPKCGTGYR
jgi:hypothetical protein